MATSFIFAAGFVLLSLLAFLTFGLGGKGNQRVPRSAGIPKNSTDLRSEFGGRLSEDICSAFSEGVQCHLNGDIQGAINIYESLHDVRLPDGTSFDLANRSQTIRHNLSLALTALSWNNE